MTDFVKVDFEKSALYDFIDDALDRDDVTVSGSRFAANDDLIFLSFFVKAKCFVTLRWNNRDGRIAAMAVAKSQADNPDAVNLLEAFEDNRKSLRQALKNTDFSD